jgi:putative solute:sodium symporter small subunit
MPAREPTRISQVQLDAYWRRTVRLTFALLAIWAVAGYGIAILMAPALNRLTFLGGPFGFWFAQNGAIYIFWVLILAYAIGMNRLDRAHGVDESEAGAEAER